MKKGAILLLLLGAIGGAWAAGWFLKPDPPPPPPLPPETVTTTTVERIVPDPELISTLKEAQSDVSRLRVELGDAYRVIDELRAETEPAPLPEQPESPDSEVVERIIQVPVRLDEMEWRGTFRGQKFVGEEDGQIRFGWAGRVACYGRRQTSEPWILVHDGPLSLEGSHATTTIRPEAALEPRWPALRAIRLGATTDPAVEVGVSWWRSGRRMGWWASVRYGLQPDETVRYVPQQDETGLFHVEQLDRWSAAAGVAWRF